MSVSSFAADRTELGWDTKRLDEKVLLMSKTCLGEAFFHKIISAIPCNWT